MYKYTVGVDGMQCNMCETHINNKVRLDLPAVKKVTSSRKKKETVVITEEDLPEDDVRKVIEQTGYIVMSMKKEPYEKKGFFSRL